MVAVYDNVGVPLLSTYLLLFNAIAPDIIGRHSEEKSTGPVVEPNTDSSQSSVDVPEGMSTANAGHARHNTNPEVKKILLIKRFLVYMYYITKISQIKIPNALF